MSCPSCPVCWVLVVGVVVIVCLFGRWGRSCLHLFIMGSCDMLAPLSGRLFDLAGGSARASVAVICRIVANKHIDACLSL